MTEVAKHEHTAELDRPTIRGDIIALQNAMLEHPDATRQLETMHHFTNGIYARTVFMPKGDLVVGKIHKKEHLVIVSMGKAKVVSEEFGAKEIVAPAVFKSPPGAKRVLLILEDMVWTTVHENSTNTQDLAKLEEEHIAQDYSEVNV